MVNGNDYNASNQEHDELFSSLTSLYLLQKAVCIRIFGVTLKSQNRELGEEEMHTHKMLVAMINQYR